MIEAVNSVLSNAPLTKQVVEQQSVARSFAANPARVQEASIQAPYISLYIKVDTTFDKAILQIRDSDTGDVVQQIPSETQLEAYRRAQQILAPRTNELPEETVELSQSVGAEIPAQTNATSPQAPSVAPAPAPAPTPVGSAPTNFTALSSINTSA